MRSWTSGRSTTTARSPTGSRPPTPSLQITVGTASGPIPIADTLNPASANYMHWYNPDVAAANPSIPGCQVDPIVYPVRALTLHWLLLGALDSHKLPDGTSCPQVSGTAPRLSCPRRILPTGRW